MIGQHITGLLAVIYIISAVAGTTYHFFLFRHFDLNVFDYWELNDFLTSGVRQPVVLLFAALAVMITAGAIWNRQFDEWAKTRGPVTRMLFGNTLFEKLGLRTERFRTLGIIAGVFFFAAVTFNEARYHAEKIATGEISRLLVAPGPDGTPHMRAHLIARTYALVVLVGVNDGPRYVLPLESIDALTICGADDWDHCDANSHEETPGSGESATDAEESSEMTVVTPAS